MERKVVVIWRFFQVYTAAGMAAGMSGAKSCCDMEVFPSIHGGWYGGWYEWSEKLL
jgi:hypothetical protein